MQVSDKLSFASTALKEGMDFLECHALFYCLVDEKKTKLHLNACVTIKVKTADDVKWLSQAVEIEFLDVYL